MMFIRITHSTSIKMGLSRVSRATGGIEVHAESFLCKEQRRMYMKSVSILD